MIYLYQEVMKQKTKWIVLIAYKMTFINIRIKEITETETQKLKGKRAEVLNVKSNILERMKNPQSNLPVYWIKREWYSL